MKALLIIFSLLLILLLAGLWVGSGSYPDQWRLDKRTTGQEAENKVKKAEINKMQADLDDVRSGDAAIEERARSELGMTGKGETFFEVILQPDQEEADKAKESQKKPEAGSKEAGSKEKSKSGDE